MCFLFSCLCRHFTHICKVWINLSDLVKNSKKSLDIFWPRLEEKVLKNSLVILLFVKRKLWAIFLPEFILQNSKHGEGGLKFKSIRDSALLSKHVFGNKNCWPLNVSSYYISCLDCLSRSRSYMIALPVVVFSRLWTRWSRSTSNFYVLIGQNLTGEFMRKIYAASWNLFTVTAEADRVLCQLVMFLTVFFCWMYEMKFSYCQESSVIHG